jgi:hypothetical protein
VTTATPLPRIALGMVAMLGQAILTARRNDALATGCPARMPKRIQLHPQHVMSLLDDDAQNYKRAHVRLQTSGELTFMNVPIEESVRFTEARLVTARNVVVPL